jgi:chromate reductase
MVIVGICGSLRKDSYNLRLLKYFGETLSKPKDFDIVLLHDIPLYNEDVESVQIPSPVNRLASKIMAADAVVFGTPEYNYSVPGVLKNAIDWLSRHPDKPLTKKVAAVMGGSPGRIGTARCQYHLRQVAVFLDLRFLNRPEVMVGEVHKKFGADGKLNDAPTMEAIAKLAKALEEARAS